MSSLMVRGFAFAIVAAAVCATAGPAEAKGKNKNKGHGVSGVVKTVDASNRRPYGDGQEEERNHRQGLHHR